MEETRTDFAYAHGIHAYLSAVPIGTADGCACYILYQAGWAQPQPAGQQRRDSQTVGWGAWTAGSRAGRRHSPAQNRAGPTGQAGRSWGVSMFPVFRGGGSRWAGRRYYRNPRHTAGRGKPDISPGENRIFFSVSLQTDLVQILCRTKVCIEIFRSADDAHFSVVKRKVPENLTPLDLA
ncbi:hypothetical protein D7X48_14930 [bacterium D16-50]|nr:hypothetical protein D7X48_14930 [bacterium D16-50]